MGFEANGGFGTEQIYIEREMQGARLNSGFDLQSNKEYCEEKKGFGANGGFDFTKELKKMLTKNIGVWSKWWICFTKEQKEV